MSFSSSIKKWTFESFFLKCFKWAKQILICTQSASKLKKFLHHSSSSGAESQCFWQGIISNCAEEVGHLAPDRKKGCLIGGGVKGNYKKRHLFIYHCHFELREWALLSLPHIFRCGATCLDGNIASRCCCCWQSSTFSFPLPRWKGWHRVGWKSYCVVFFFDKINKV